MKKTLVTIMVIGVIAVGLGARSFTGDNRSAANSDLASWISSLNQDTPELTPEALKAEKSATPNNATFVQHKGRHTEVSQKAETTPAKTPAQKKDKIRAYTQTPSTMPSVTTRAPLHDSWNSRKKAAWEKAASENWEQKVKTEDEVRELIDITSERVYVYKTQNKNAAISTHAFKANYKSDGALKGNGVTVGVWDAGTARDTHQELSGKVTKGDAGYAHNHATHVTGTIAARGVLATAQGMAPQAKVLSYEWNQDTTEMKAVAMTTPGEEGKIQVSNHSYGFIAGWDKGYKVPRWFGTWGASESEYFGAYGYFAGKWDDMCYNAPYFLPFKSAGNDRSNRAPLEGRDFQYYDNGWKTAKYKAATGPKNDGFDQGGFDTLPELGNAKNVMTVGAVNDAVYNGSRTISKATMSPFSGWGPTDDGRIKPDVVANGVRLYSSLASGDQKYGSYSGTSMASPNAAGSSLLIIEEHSNLFPGEFLRSSALKGLIIHTATDLGRPGPDYTFGWGLMNVMGATDQLKKHKNNPNAYHLHNDSITADKTEHAYSVNWNGKSAMKATISWTDPKSLKTSRGLDDRTSMLVHDLDLVIVDPKGNTHRAFVLNPNKPANNATQGDNNIDNVEQVLIKSPIAGTYTIQVSLDGELIKDEQIFSLIVSGSEKANESTEPKPEEPKPEEPKPEEPKPEEPKPEEPKPEEPKPEEPKPEEPKPEEPKPAQNEITGTVWNDTNQNGTKDANEGGIPNITISMFKDANSNNILDGGDSFKVALHTDATGHYVFKNLDNASYMVYVDQASLPSGIQLATTPQAQSANLAANAAGSTLNFGFSLSISVPRITKATAILNSKGVKLDWSFDKTSDLIGFYVYRSSDPKTKGKRINRGVRTKNKTNFSFTDVNPAQNQTMYYWISIADKKMKFTNLGPIPVHISGSSNDNLLDASSKPLATFEARKAGLHAINKADLNRAGVNTSAFSAKDLQISVNGKQIAIDNTATGSYMTDNDEILFFIPVDCIGKAWEVRHGPITSAMKTVNVNYRKRSKRMGLFSANKYNEAYFNASTSKDTLLVNGFDVSLVWLLDISNPWEPIMLTNPFLLKWRGENTAYFKYMKNAPIFAAADSAVQITDNLTAN